MNIGAELREARQRAGLSREAVSQRTKIQLAKIDALEANAFERLPEGIYLDGLIRAYATEIGLDGSEMLARLHRHNAIPLEDELDAADPLAVQPPSPIATSVPEPEPPSPFATSVPDPDPAPAADFFINPAAVPPPERPLSPVSTSVPATERPPSPLLTSVPERRGIGRFVIPLLALLAAIGLGAYLYDRTRPFATREDIAAPAISHENTVAADAANASAAPNTSASDVIPADRPGSTEHHNEAELDAPAAAPRPIPSPAREPARARADDTATPSAPAPDDTRASPAEAAPDASAAAANDLSGVWRLSTHVQSSSVRDYEGLELGYRLKLQQSGARIAGEGMKTLENGREIAAFAQTPIVVTGTLEGGRLTLTFTERGRRRDSGGKMILQVHEDGVLRGRFSSSAAKSSGTAEARRPEG